MDVMEEDSDPAAELTYHSWYNQVVAAAGVVIIEEASSRSPSVVCQKLLWCLYVEKKVHYEASSNVVTVFLQASRSNKSRPRS